MKEIVENDVHWTQDITFKFCVIIKIYLQFDEMKSWHKIYFDARVSKMIGTWCFTLVSHRSHISLI